MAPRKKTLLGQLEALEAEVVQARLRVREAEAERTAALADTERLQAALTDAHARGDVKATVSIGREKAKADAVVDRLSTVDVAGVKQPGPVIAGAKLAAERTAAERQRFVAENHDGLCAELAAGDQAAANAVGEAIRGLTAAVAGWQARERRHLDLIPFVPGVDGRSIPGLGGIDQVARDLSRSTAGGAVVPVPAPMTPMTAARVVEPEEMAAQSLVEVPVWSDGERVA